MPVLDLPTIKTFEEKDEYLRERKGSILNCIENFVIN